MFPPAMIKGDLMNQLFSEEVIVPVALFAMVVLLVWFGHRSGSIRTREQADIRKRLLDKFGSGQELTEFLGTPQGQSFLKDQEMSANGSPRSRIVGLTVAGVILTMLGAAFFALMGMKHAFVYPASIIGALGIGILLAAAIAHRLYKKWDMLR